MLPLLFIQPLYLIKFILLLEQFFFKLFVSGLLSGLLTHTVYHKMVLSLVNKIGKDVELNISGLIGGTILALAWRD